MAFFAPDVAGGGVAINKSGYSATATCDSTAAGDPFPPHFQLKTLTQTVVGQRMSINWFTHTNNVFGRFGYISRRSFPCTFGMNKRAGMNTVELEKYLKNSILLPLYPDQQDYPGKQVLLKKLDSGMGRLNVEMLADLRRGCKACTLFLVFLTQQPRRKRLTRTMDCTSLLSMKT
jgi:hypothetical protein